MSFYNDALQQNNTELQSNNTDLQGLLDTINALPVAENLDTVLAQQETLIEDIKTALEGKAAGGTSVETCQLHVGSDGSSMNVIYTGLINGVPHSYFRHDKTSDIDTDNCICGSVVICIMSLACTYSVENASIVDNNFLYGTLLPEGHASLSTYCYAFRIDAPPGGLVTIYLEEDL